MKANVLSPLMNKWRQLSPVKKASLSLIFAKFFQKGLSMISGPIFTRIMPQSEYGVISTFTSWQSVLYIVATLNMASGVFNNGMVDFKDDRDGFVGSIMSLANICTLTCFVIYLLFKRGIDDILGIPPILTYTMIAYFFVTPAYNYWMGRKRFEYSYVSVTVITIVSSILSTMLAIVAVLAVADNSKAIAKVMATEIVSIGIGIFFTILTLIKSRGKNKFRYWKYALTISIPLVPHYLSIYILSSSDRIMISKLINTSVTAIYNVASTVASIMLIFWNAVDASYAPWIYQKMDEKKYSTITSRGNQVLSVFAGMTILSTLFAPEIMRILAPANYYEGIYIIPAVAAATFFTACSSLYIRVELFLKKSGTVMLGSCMAALLNIVLNYLCIKRFGYMAAGYTTMICYLALAVFHGANLKRLNYNVYNNRFVMIISIIVIICVAIVSLLYRFTAVRYLLILTLILFAAIKRDTIIGVMRKR